MKQTVVIKPIKSKNITLSGEYFDKQLGKTISLLVNGDVTTEPLKQDERKFYFRFTPQNPELKVTFEWKELGDKTRNETDKYREQKEKARLKFYKEHSLIKIEGEPDKPYQALFHLQVLEDVNRRDYERLRLKGTVYNTVNACDEQTQRDICFMFGGNPTNKTEHEVFIDLLDFNEGRLMIFSKPEEFIEKWNQKSNPDMQYTINVKKAITYGIIETKDNVYRLGHEVLGKTVDEVIAYVKSNYDLYDKFILPDIGKKEFALYNQEKKDSAKKEMNDNIPPKNENYMAKKAIEDLRQKGKALGIESWHVKSPSKLQKEIEALETETAE